MNQEIFPHEYFMGLAMQQAHAAREIDEVPVGAVIQRNGRVIGAAHNLTRQLRDPTAHAEMLAITQAAEAIGDWRLIDCTMYVTLEPCTMCAGALVLARVPTVVFGATDPKTGAVESVYQVLSNPKLNHRAEIISGVMDKQSQFLLTDFFQAKRDEGKK
jgi:tRNA(adenine34) deaminase